MPLNSGRTVKDLIKEAKYYSSIAVDLALYSLASGSKIAAMEVLQIEERIDQVVRELVAKASLSVRGPDQAGLAIAIAEIARAFDRITDAAGDLAGLVIRDYPIHRYVRSVVNCCGEIISLIKSSRSVSELDGNVDILLVRRGDNYILAPREEKILEGDLLVVRGTPEEVLQVARQLEEPGDRTPLGSSQLVSAALAGDELAAGLLKLKNMSRLMLEISFHALIYVDRSLATLIQDLESGIDNLYLEVLEDSYASTIPARAKESISISIFATALETLADAAVFIARIASSPEYEEYSEFLGEAVEEAEEGYTRLKVTSKLDGVPLRNLNLADLGVEVLAAKRGSAWILPVPQDYVLKEGDVLLVKYFKEAGVEEPEDEAEMLASLDEKGFQELEEIEE
ncbi:MAG: hypothetical protein F7B19_00740 [Desulfurococcales archaeon]|nr:hypothetical protein [Desulfurococcales archaeon]